MNIILDKDAGLIERARAHGSNLAHSLNTPLSITSAETEGAVDGTVIREHARTMQRLIGHHLGGAPAVAGTGRSLGARVPVLPVAEGIAGALAKIFAETKVAIDIDLTTEIAFRGRGEDLEEILGNPLENACKWAKDRVRVPASDSAKGLVLSIDDDGPGLAPALVGEAARRGKRLDEKSPDWGLGLSIVSDLVQVDGGEIHFSKSDLGGLSVVVHFPHPEV